MFKFAAPTVAVAIALAPAAFAVPQGSTSNSAASNSLSALFSDKVVARGKGVEIKRSQLDEEVIRIKAQLAARNQPVPPDKQALLEQGILEQLVTVELLQQRATAEDKNTGKAAAEKQFEEAKKQLGNEELLNMRLKAENLTKEQLQAKWAQQATAEAVVRREVKVNVTPADLKKYYDENPARFEQPETVRASHILLETRDAQRKELPEAQKAEKRKKIEELLKRARAGEDFAALVKQFSEDKASIERGGEYTFPRGRMVPEFEAAAFSLAPGQVSDAITTQYGYHIIKLHEKIPAKKVPLAEVEKDLKEALTKQAIQAKLPDYIKQLKEEAGLQILDPALVRQEPSAETKQ